MKSDIYNLTISQNDFHSIPAEAEKTAKYNELDKKSALRLRLIAEEMICMLPQLLSYGSGKFWIENSGSSYELHLSVTPKDTLDVDTEKVLSVSTSGKNAAAKGIIGKICTAVETMLNTSAKLAREDPYAFPMAGMYDYAGSMAWSLTTYRKELDSVPAKGSSEEWDELERSIIANIADEVIVGIRGGKIDIVIKKEF